MKRLISMVLVVLLAVGTVSVFAAPGRKGASDKALENASDEAIFHRVGDWFATRGKSDTEKKAILAERKAKRTAAHAQKEAEKQKKKMEKKAEKAKNKMKDMLKGAGKK